MDNTHHPTPVTVLFDSQGHVLPPAASDFAVDAATPEQQQRREAMARIAEAMEDLTQRGAKAHRSGMDSVRVPVTHLFVVCQAMYAVLGPRE